MSDSPLTPRGRAQAATQNRLLQGVVAAHPSIPLYHSPLGRARHTAEIAAQGIAIARTAMDDLKEISAGSWDGALLSEIERSNAPLFEEARNAFELMFLSPDGDAEEAVLARAKRVLSALDAPAVLVTHGAFLCVLRGLLRGLEWDRMLDLTHEQGCIYVLEAGGETIVRDA